MSIKKNFESINTILLNNQDKKVSEIMTLLLVEMESKQQSKAHFEDNHGLWVFCYYHKEWELVEKQVEYGSKANTKTGFNTMCKIGVNCWTKQQRDFKESNRKLVDRLAAKTLKIEDLESERERLQLEKNQIVSLSDFHFESANEYNIELIHEVALVRNEEK